MHHLLYLIPVLVVIASTTHAADLDDVPVIDCHVHLWDTNRPEMTWPREEHVKLYKPFLPTTHTPICRANGVKGVVVVLSGQALVDNQWNLNVTAHNARSDNMYFFNSAITARGLANFVCKIINPTQAF